MAKLLRMVVKNCGLCPARVEKACMMSDDIKLRVSIQNGQFYDGFPMRCPLKDVHTAGSFSCERGLGAGCSA